MKTFKFLMPFLLAAFTLVGCNTDDLRNDIDELKNRVESLEAQVSALNDNVNALKVFVDGNKTIKSYEKTEDGYKIVLSDGEELNITQGSAGQVMTPEISINEDGYWVIDGEPTSNKAEGDNAPAPKFSIDDENYWTVDFGIHPERVLGADGMPVKATTSDSVGFTDAFFKEVKIDGDKMVLTYKDGKEYSLPIVEDLVCQIVTDGVDGFKDGVLTLGFGKTVELQVKVSGDNFAVTAPAGWVAVLSDPVDGSATLSLTAPASNAPASRATADNTKDLVLQVNKGVNWAVDKIQVEVKDVVESYYQEYLNGQDLVLGNVNGNSSNAFVLNKTSCPETMVKYIDSDQEITEDNIVYFIKEGVKVTYSVDKITTLILIGDKPGKKPILEVKKIMSLSGEASGKGLIMYNIVLDATAHTNYVLNIDKNVAGTTYSYLYLIDNCEIKLPNGKNFSYINNKANVEAKKIVMCNTYVKVPSQGNPMITSIGGGYKYTDFVMHNNVFYSQQSATGLEKFTVLAAVSTEASFQNIEISNNTFINLFGANVYAKAVVKDTLKVRNNLIWNDAESTANTYLVQALANSDLSKMVSDDYSNNKLYSKNNPNAMVFNTAGVKPEGLSGNNLVNEVSDPFTGGVFNLEDGKFIPGPGYETIGAHIE